MRWPAYILWAGMLPAAFAAAPTGAPRPRIWADLADGARSLPGEFAADTLLRIAAAPGLDDVAFRRQIIEDAFHLASAAQEPFARRRWPGAPVRVFDKAYLQGLDACTLQCRAVDAMLPIDYRKARQLFADMPAPRIMPADCDDAMAPDPSIFYATLNEVASRAYSAKEIAAEEPFHLMERYASAGGSIVQAEAVAQMLAGAPLNPAQLETLVDTFAATLSQLSPDPRSSAVAGEAGTAISALAAVCRNRNIDVQPLLAAWRAYSARKYEGEACKDAAGLCTSPECTQFTSRFKDLTLGKNGLSLTAAQRSTPEWGGQLREYLSALLDWRSDDHPAECFHTKSQYYGELFDLAPNPPDRDLLLRSWLAWLERDGYRRDRRVEWFYPVNTLLIRAFADPHGMHAVIDALLNSPDPVIAFYARLERLLPRPIDRTFSLL
ncbi:MAG TPA: hypothetical protein VMI94_01040 [Bryobacteraceae bacterium]|nr:hypothetical protein [Bryobacteraceae bacterium]